MAGEYISPYMTGQNGSANGNPGYAGALADANNNFMKSGQQFDQELHDAIGQHKQNVQDAANADLTFQLLVPKIKQAGMQLDPDIVAKYAGASLSAKKGMIGALATQYATNLTAQKDQAQIGSYQAQTNEANTRAATLQQNANRQDDEVGGLASWATTMDQTLNDPNNPDREALFKQFGPSERANLHAVAQMGASNPRLAAPLLKEIFDRFGGKPANAVGYSQDPITGKRVVTYGNEMQPSGEDPSFNKNDGGATAVRDEDGNVLGYNIPKGGKGGGYNFVKPDALTADQKQNAILSHQKQITALFPLIANAQNNPDTLKAINDEIATHRNAVTQLQTKAKPAASGDGAAQPMPTDKSKMVKGQAYQTSKGVYTWDGTQFTK